MDPVFEVWNLSYMCKLPGIGWYQRELFSTSQSDLENINFRIREQIEKIGGTFAWGMVRPFPEDSIESIEDSLYPNITMH